MNGETFIVGNGITMRRLIMRLMSLTFARPWRITVEQVSPGRTLDQNAKLRAMERTIAEHCGHDPDELHEILLARRFGTKEVTVGKHTWSRPARRSSDLTRAEMADYITWVQAFASRDLGLDVG